MDSLLEKQSLYKDIGPKKFAIYKSNLKAKFGKGNSKNLFKRELEAFKTTAENISKETTAPITRSTIKSSGLEKMVEKKTKEVNGGLLKKFIPKSKAGKLALGMGLAAGGYAAYKHYKNKNK